MPGIHPTWVKQLVLQDDADGHHDEAAAIHASYYATSFWLMVLFSEQQLPGPSVIERTAPVIGCRGHLIQMGMHDLCCLLCCHLTRQYLCCAMFLGLAKPVMSEAAVARSAARNLHQWLGLAARQWAAIATLFGDASGTVL